MSWSKTIPLEGFPTFLVDILLFSGKNSMRSLSGIVVGFPQAAFTRLDPVSETDNQNTNFGKQNQTLG